MSRIDELAKQLEVQNNPRPTLMKILKSWRSPSLAMILIFAALQSRLKSLWNFMSNGGGGSTSNATAAGLTSPVVGNGEGSVATPTLTGFGSAAAGLAAASGMGWGSGILGHPGSATSNGPLLAVGAWASLTIISFIGANFWSLYNYFDPLNALFRQTWIDSRHGQQAESHKWLTALLEQSAKYKKSRDLEATNFQSVRDRDINNNNHHRDDGWGDPYRGSSRGRNNNKENKILEVIHDSRHADVPIFFQPRDIEEFWFIYAKTVFRVNKRAPKTVRRSSPTSWNHDYDDYGQAEPAIHVRAFCRSRKPLLQFLAYARDEYYAGFKEQLYMQVSTYDDFQWNQAPMRLGRSFDTIIIPQEMKTLLLDDIKEFLDSHDWYSSRGIPWKRGYMFYGPPGNGKTSTIQAIASTFDLPIYTLPVASAGFSDSTLQRAMSRLVSRCILVLEDLDALAWENDHRKTEEAEDPFEIPPFGGIRSGSPAEIGRRLRRVRAALDEKRLSLSALLNCLDGIDSGEGRIVIATTNFLDGLDKALIRPGRFDVFINYKKATRTQAQDLFLQFYKDYSSKRDLPDDISVDEEFDYRMSKGGIEVTELALKWKSMVEDEQFSVAALQGHLIANKASPHAAVDSMPAFLQKAKDDAAEEAAKKMKILPSLAATRMATGASPFTPGYPLKLLNEVPAIGSLTPVSALDAADLAQVKPKRRLST